ncbi:hypothetical protein ACNF42_03575 [Cuniculiplasma sp. SKW3]|uniref:hypothetical protein n=1 Tax=Cuniculiplasma sp. SKW3 TaxID=3400170 RepID=UPI003FD329D0
MNIMDLEKIEEPKELAEEIHLLKKVGEQFFFSEKAGRLICGREYPLIENGKESPYEKVMEHVSKVLGIKDRKTYEEADLRYNLTMY